MGGIVELGALFGSVCSVQKAKSQVRTLFAGPAANKPARPLNTRLWLLCHGCHLFCCWLCETFPDLRTCYCCYLYLIFGYSSLLLSPTNITTLLTLSAFAPKVG